VKIVHITPYYAPAFAYGGVVAAVSGLASAQAANGHQVTVLTTDALAPGRRSKSAAERIDGVSVQRFPNLFPTLRRLNLSTPRGMANALRVLEPDVIHYHELRTVEALLTLPHARAPLVLSAHGTLPYAIGRATFKRLWDRLLGARLLARFGAVAALTDAEAADIRALWSRFHIPLPLLDTISNGVNVPAAWRFTTRSYAQPDQGAFNILYLGRLHERKGVHLLIAAFAEAALPNTRLVIAGPDEGMLAHLQALAVQHAVADRVLFTGYIEGRKREEVLSSADLFALPAEGEGLPMAALEAMAAGVPVLLTPGCNLPETVARNAGLVVERTVPALAAGIRDLMHDPTRRARMGIAARAWMVSAYGWGPVALRMLRLYDQLLEKTG